MFYSAEHKAFLFYTGLNETRPFNTFGMASRHCPVESKGERLVDLLIQDIVQIKVTAFKVVYLSFKRKMKLGCHDLPHIVQQQNARGRV